MMFRNHIVVTAAVTIVSVNNFDFTIPIWLAIGCIAVGSLLPDLDHPGSTIGRRMLFISIPLSGVFGHRQMTHSIWPFVGVFWLFNLDGQGSHIALALAIGYFSHLLGDILSDSGIPLFWPLQTRVSVKLCSSGGALEYIIAYGLLITSIII